MRITARIAMHAVRAGDYRAFREAMEPTHPAAFWSAAWTALRRSDRSAKRMIGRRQPSARPGIEAEHLVKFRLVDTAAPALARIVNVPVA